MRVLVPRLFPHLNGAKIFSAHIGTINQTLLPLYKSKEKIYFGVSKQIKSLSQEGQVSSFTTLELVAVQRFAKHAQSIENPKLKKGNLTPDFSDGSQKFTEAGRTRYLFKPVPNKSKKKLWSVCLVEFGGIYKFHWIQYWCLYEANTFCIWPIFRLKCRTLFNSFKTQENSLIYNTIHYTPNIKDFEAFLVKVAS